MSRTNANGSTITDLIGATPVAKLDGGQPAVWRFPELSGTQTFKAGEGVCLSGAVAGAKGLTNMPTDLSGFGIIGFAADDAAGTTSSFRGVYVATPSTLFLANIGHSATSASAQTAATDLGNCYGLTSLSGRTYVNKAQSSGTFQACRVVGLYEGDSHPCFYGRVYFTVLQDRCQLYNNGYVQMSGLQI